LHGRSREGDEKIGFLFDDGGRALPQPRYKIAALAMSRIVALVHSEVAPPLDSAFIQQ
jgi:hypothetical protein